MKNKMENIGLQNDDEKKVVSELTESLKKTLLDKKETNEEAVKYIFEMTKELFDKKGWSYYYPDDIKKLCGNRSYIIRRENPEKVIKMVIDNERFSVECDEDVGHKYTNCAVGEIEFGSKALHNAFLEGRENLGGMVFVNVIKPNKKIELSDVPQDLSFGKIGGYDRTQIKTMEGLVDPEDVQLILVRIPSTHFPEELMNERELEALDEYQEYLDELGDKPLPQNPRIKLPQIFRAFSDKK
jgi:hypothetical protein